MKLSRKTINIVLASTGIVCFFLVGAVIRDTVRTHASHRQATTELPDMVISANEPTE